MSKGTAILLTRNSTRTPNRNLLHYQSAVQIYKSTRMNRLTMSKFFSYFIVSQTKYGLSSFCFFFFEAGAFWSFKGKEKVKMAWNSLQLSTCMCFDVDFNNLSVISQCGLDVARSLILSFIVLPHWSIMLQTLDMIPHAVTLL